MINHKVFIADLQILGAAFCFGIGFIGQRAVSVDGLGPMTCNCLRFGLSAILLTIILPLIPAKYLNSENGNEHVDDRDDEELLDKDVRKEELKSVKNYEIFCSRILGNTFYTKLAELKKTVLFWGIFLGCINFFGSGLQQWGITMTSANKVAFIAGFDLFLTPMFAYCIPTFKRNGKPNSSTWIAVMMSIVGLYLLSDADIRDLQMGLGERLTLVSTVFWTLHITYTDIATAYVDSMHMMVVQFVVVSVLSGIVAILVEPQAWFLHHFLFFVPWMFFLAIVEGLAFTLMAMGQNYSPPTHAALILSLEGVFASIASYFCLGETLTRPEFVGGLLMLLATLIAKVGCFSCITNILDGNGNASGATSGKQNTNGDIELSNGSNAVNNNNGKDKDSSGGNVLLDVLKSMILFVQDKLRYVQNGFEPPAQMYNSAK